MAFCVCSDMASVVGKGGMSVKKNTDWVKALLTISDRLEVESWEGDTHDAGACVH